MQINEIFSSIEGEGIRTGYLATFVRTFGCNLACSYCDTRYACIPNPEVQLPLKNLLKKDIVKHFVIVVLMELLIRVKRLI